MSERAARGSLVALVPLLALSFVGCAAPADGPVVLRLQVSLTPDELATFEPALRAVDEAHPAWTVTLESVPQGSESERVTTQLAAGEMPDVLRLQGLTVQQWIRRGAFMDLSRPIADAPLDLSDFYAGPLAQYQFEDAQYGVPDTASPEVIFYDRAAFAEAGIEPPTDTWTFDDMRAAAVALTVDGAGRTPDDPDFDPTDIARWGFNRGLVNYWQNEEVRALGGELCVNEDCTLMDFTAPANEAAVTWWIELVRDKHAAPYDPYGGSQTGVPGDPFIAGKAAMGINGSFAIGQLNALGTIDYDIAPPFIGVDGERHTTLSTNAYLVAADTQHPEQAWQLVQALTDTDFLAATWGRPGHAVPARRSAAGSVIDPDRAPTNQQAILEAMEVGVVFRPNTSRAFEAYGASADLFLRMNTGDLAITEALGQIEQVVNEALAADRSP